MSLSRLRKAPGRWLERVSNWSRRRGRDDPHQASDTDVGGRCCEVSGNGLDRHHGHRQCKISSSHQRHHRRTSYNEDCIEEESSMSGTSSSGGGGGQHFTAGNPRQQHHRAPHSSGNNEYEQPVLSERDRKELMSLANENISMDFILEMKEAFQLFDKNGDGFISAKELGVLMRTLGRNPTEDEIMNIMNEIDVDHNGKLDFSEFTIMMRDKLSGEDMEQEIKQAFRVFDRNGDGYISKNEFKHCMMHFGEKFTDDEVEEMISEADANNDGQIDYTEFSQMILKEIDMESSKSSHPQNHHKSPLHKKIIS